MLARGYVRPKYMDVQGNAYWYEPHAGLHGFRASMQLARQDAREILARGEKYMLIIHPKTKWKFNAEGLMGPHRGVAWMSCYELRGEDPREWGPVSSPDEARLVNGLYMLGVERNPGRNVE